MRTRLPLIALLALAAAGCTAETATPPGGPPSVPVVVAKVESRDVPLEIDAIGNVEAVSTVAIKSRVEGQIEAVHFEEGSEVRRGRLLFTIDERPFRVALAQAEAALARDRARLRKAEEDVKRYAGLVDKEYVTREQYDSVVADAEALRATISADEATVEGAKLDLSYCEIRSPIDGRAGTLSVREGNLVKANADDPLVTVRRTRPIYVTFSVPESRLDDVRRKQAEGALVVEARPRGAGGAPRIGKLDVVDNAVDERTGTIRLKALFPNEDGELWPGRFVEVALRLEEERGATVVPKTAIQNGQKGTYVWVVGADSTAASREIVVERDWSDWSVVSRGLEPGETVVIDGQLRVSQGAKLEAKE